MCGVAVVNALIYLAYELDASRRAREALSREKIALEERVAVLEKGMLMREAENHIASDNLSMTRIRVVYDCLIPNGAANEKDVTEWLAFHHKIGEISNSNPLHKIEPTPISNALGWGTVGVGHATTAQAWLAKAHKSRSVK